MDKTVVCVSEYGVALVSLEIARTLSEKIYDAATSHDCCIVDFSGVLSITTQFANAMFSPLVIKLGIDKFRQKIRFDFPNDDIMFTVSEAIDIQG